MIVLKIDPPKNLWTKLVFKNEQIPCICRVSANIEIVFSELIFGETVVGTIEGVDRIQIQERMFVGAGGDYRSVDHCLISVGLHYENKIEVRELKIFNRGKKPSWHPVIENGEYGPSLYEDDGF